MPTQLIRSECQITPKMQGGVVTIGNFDGVHLGHQQLLAGVVAAAKARSVPSILVTFEPHPVEFFSQDKISVARLTRLREKYLALATSQIDYVIILKFNQELANMSASDFADKILAKTLKPCQLYVGEDFRFGQKRQGDISLLRQVGQQYGFEVITLPDVLWAGERISSTRIRQALAAGDFELAEKMLGRPYTMSGRVHYGNQIGRRLGFPTANLPIQRSLAPLQGIFTALVHGLSDQPLQAAASLGTRPAVGGTKTLLEVHLLDFNQEIYGRFLTVQFCKKLREEAYYPTLELLSQQIASDVEATREYFQHISALPLK